jgi:hypothetical protein
LISHFVDGEDQKEVKLEWMRKRRGSPFLSRFGGVPVPQFHEGNVAELQGLQPGIAKRRNHSRHADDLLKHPCCRNQVLCRNQLVRRNQWNSPVCLGSSQFLDGLH